MTKQKKRGRGRPFGTFKERYVPGKGIVKVPTEVYRRMITQSKVDQRVKKAMEKNSFKKEPSSSAQILIEDIFINAFTKSDIKEIVISKDVMIAKVYL